MSTASAAYAKLADYYLRCRNTALELPSRQEMVQYWSGIGFMLDGRRYVAPLEQVSEILTVPSYTRVPGVESWMKGVANVRGRLMAVMDLTAEYYLQTIETVFQQHALPDGKMMHRGRLVNPGAIENTALMTVEGEKDDISGIGQTQAAHSLCKNLPESMKIDYVQKDVGHYGVFNGSRWRSEIAPRIRDFIRANNNA